MEVCLYAFEAILVPGHGCDSTVQRGYWFLRCLS